MQLKETKYVTFSRRAVLRTGLYGMGLYFVGVTGCESGEGYARRVPEFTDQGYRLYGLTLKPDADSYGGILAELELPLLSVHWNHSWRLQAEPAFYIAVWATEEEAGRLRQHPDFDSVFQKGPSHVAELGSAETAHSAEEGMGLLAVKLMPTPDEYPQLGRPSATAEQVVHAWRSTIDEDAGIVIEPGPEPAIPESVGLVPVAGQVVVRFTSATLEPEVLDRILDHPQVIAIQWGSLFAYLHCPPCGMG